MSSRSLSLFLILGGIVIATLVMTHVGTPPETAELGMSPDAGDMGSPPETAEVGARPEARFDAAPQLGEMVPDLEIVDDEGNPVRLRELTQGHYTVLTLGCLT